MDTLDRTITDLAAAQGTTLTPPVLTEVKRALANAYIDSVLDGRKMASEDVADDDDIVSDDESDKEDREEAQDKNKSPSNPGVTTGYRPATSMGAV